MTDELALNRQVCFALYTASRATTAAYRAMLDGLGITYPQYLVLLVLWDTDGRGVRDIGEQLDLDTGTLSPLLKRLETMGLIERRRQRADERRVWIYLTPNGNALKARASDIPAQIAQATGLSTSELADLRDTLTRLGAAMQSSISKEGTQ